MRDYLLGMLSVMLPFAFSLREMVLLRKIKKRSENIIEIKERIIKIQKGIINEMREAKK